MSILRLLGLAGLSAFFVGCGGEVRENDPPEEPGTTLWVRRFGRDGYGGLTGLAGVESGGVIVVGRYHGEVDLGGGMLPSPGNRYQAYVARYDGEGKHVYSRSFGGAYDEESYDVAALPDGSALVTGAFGGGLVGEGLELDGISLPWSGGSGDAFVAKLDPAGKVVWARSFDGEFPQRAQAIAAMPDGGAVVAIVSHAPINLAPGAPPPAPSDDYLVRLDPEGAPVWSRVLASVHGIVSIQDIDVRDGTIAVSGAYDKDLHLGLDGDMDISLVSKGSYDAFVVTYDLEGKPRAARSFGGHEGDTAPGIAIMADGGLVLTGEIQGNVDLGGGFLGADSKYDTKAYLLELDAALEHRRSLRFDGSNGNWAHALALREDGGVLLTGTMAGEMSFGPSTISSGEDAGADVFVGGLDADRRVVFAKGFGGAEAQHGERVVVDGTGRIYVAGSATGVADFGLGLTPGTGYFETFLVALAP